MVIPASGTAVVFAENEKLIPGRPPAFCEVKAHVPGVGSNPGGPVMIPVPLTERNFAVRCVHR